LKLAFPENAPVCAGAFFLQWRAGKSPELRVGKRRRADILFGNFYRLPEKMGARAAKMRVCY